MATAVHLPDALPVTARAAGPAWRQAPRGVESLAIAAVFVIGHAVLGVAMSYSALLATVVAGSVMVGALGVAAFSKRLELAFAAAVYVGASDVLWRMTNAKVPWEGGKYVFTLTLLLVLARFVRPLRHSFAPLFYLFVLLPSCAIAVWQLGPSLARGEMASTLAGPIALGVSVLAFRQFIATETEARQLLWAVIGPAVGVAAIATKATIAAGTIKFSGESNFVTSGGYGPNQVSNILGAGAVCCLLIALSRTPLRVRVLALVTGAWLVGQALLTLSRGGVWGFVAAGVCIGLAGLLTSGTRSRVLTVGLVVVLAAVLVYSWVNLFTAGSLANRYADQSSTNRSDIVQGDVALFLENPLFGVGPGVSKYVRTGVLEADGSAHTEYSRLLAEHGMFGLVALATLVVMFVQSVRSTITSWNRFLCVGVGVYAMFTMTHSATRIAIVAVMFGMAVLRVEADPERPVVSAEMAAWSQPTSYRASMAARRARAER